MNDILWYILGGFLLAWIIGWPLAYWRLKGKYIKSQNYYDSIINYYKHLMKVLCQQQPEEKED